MTSMDEPQADEAMQRLEYNGVRFRKNARAFLIAVARYVELCEAREARQALANPWLRGQVAGN